MADNNEFVYSDGQKTAAHSSTLTSKIQSQQGLEDSSASTVTAPCLSCGSTRINLVKMSDYGIHHTPSCCVECDRFIGWETKPANQEKQQRQTKINRLLEFSQLNQWERTFLELLKGKKISPKQQEVLTKIEANVRGAA